jgi:hypothetical protein
VFADVKQAASERAIHSAVASERLAMAWAALKLFSPILFRLQQLFAEACQAIAVTADRDHVAVVKEAIEDRGCHHGIAEHRTAVADAAIAGEQDCALLVPAADQLEEEVRGVGFKRQIAEFVDDQELGLGKVREPLLEPTFGMTLGELCFALALLVSTLSQLTSRNQKLEFKK